MSDLFGAIGSVAGAAMQANAIKDATKMQIDALNQQRNFVYNQLDPSVIGKQALTADVGNANARYALQGAIDPGLLAGRYAGENVQNTGLENLLTGNAAQVGNLATGEAFSGNNATKQGQQALIDAALGQLAAGATLPSDVQAELVRTGLERSGMTTGAASPKGFGGTITRELIGQAGLALQQQRQKQAADLLSQAQGLQNQRQTLLTQLFPNLQTQQMGNISAGQSAVANSTGNMPNAGLSGNDVSNLWLARVGATNQLAQSAANAGARGAILQSQAWAPAFGAVSNTAAGLLPSTKSVYNSVFGGGDSFANPQY